MRGSNSLTLVSVSRVRLRPMVSKGTGPVPVAKRQQWDGQMMLCALCCPAARPWRRRPLLPVTDHPRAPHDRPIPLPLPPPHDPSKLARARPVFSAGGGAIWRWCATHTTLPASIRARQTRRSTRSARKPAAGTPKRPARATGTGTKPFRKLCRLSISQSCF
jgi:hypothetical protein